MESPFISQKCNLKNIPMKRNTNKFTKNTNAWYSFLRARMVVLHPFIFNVFMSLYLKWIFVGSVVVSCVFFLIYSDNLCLLNSICRLVTFKMIIHVAGLIFLKRTLSDNLTLTHWSLLVLIHIYTFIHMYTCTHSLILSHTHASTHTYTRAYCRGWWEAQEGLLFAPDHTAQLGQAWYYSPSWPFPNCVPQGTQVCLGVWTVSDPCLPPASNWCQNKPPTEYIPELLCH